MLPDLFQGMWVQRNSTETQQLSHILAIGLDQKSKIEKVEVKIGRSTSVPPPQLGGVVSTRNSDGPKRQDNFPKGSDIHLIVPQLFKFFIVS